jgi:hypothetical protein
MQTISQQLNDRYNNFIGAIRPWDFFERLSFYWIYVLKTPDLRKIVEEQLAIRDEVYAEIAELEEKSIDEFLQVKKKLIKIIERNKIDINTFVAFTSAIPVPRGQKMENILEQMEAIEDGRISMSGYRSDHLERFLHDLAANLLKLGFGKNVEEFIAPLPDAQAYYARINGHDLEFTHGGSTHGDFIFSHTWPKRFEKERAVDRIKKSKAWGAFDKFTQFWEAHQEYSKDSSFRDTIVNVSKNLSHEFEGHYAINVIYAVQDLELLAENHETTDKVLRFLRVDDFRTWAVTVEAVLLDSLPENNTPEAKMTSRARTAALKKAKDEAWRDKIDIFAQRFEDFINEYETDKLENEAEFSIGKWWSNDDKPIYSSETGSIIWKNKECKIPLTAINQLAICEEAFSESHFFGDWIKEIDVVTRFSKGEDSKRSLSDAVRHVNKRTKIDFGVDIFKYDASRRYRIRSQELFT